MLEEVVKQLEDALNKLDKPTDIVNLLEKQRKEKQQKAAQR
jgi:hypothetical protein